MPQCDLRWVYWFFCVSLLHGAVKSSECGCSGFFFGVLKVFKAIFAFSGFFWLIGQTEVQCWQTVRIAL